jgi:hypothetical protein
LVPAADEMTAPGVFLIAGVQYVMVAIKASLWRRPGSEISDKET